jgi:hypothetical protein
MTQDEFWDHIRASRRRDPDDQADLLAARLAHLPADEVLDFGRRWLEAKARAHTWDLWGAAYLVNGGCDADGFDEFRNWLILQGDEVFAAAVADPDTLAAVLTGNGEIGTDAHPSYDAYCAATGRDDYVAALRARHPDAPGDPPLAKAWDFDDPAAMRARFPRLAAAYPTDEE